jgi:hypothetical protein
MDARSIYRSIFLKNKFNNIYIYLLYMDLYHKRSKIILDLFMKTYSDSYIIVFTKFNDIYEIILNNGKKIMLYTETKWNEITSKMNE